MTSLKILLATAAFAVAVPASAASFLMNFATSLGNGSASFTTVGDGSTPTLITSLTGTFGGNAMTLLAPGSYPGGAENDNLFTNLAPYFSFNGLSFAAGGQNYNFYDNQGAVQICGITPGCGLGRVNGFEVSAGGVPEPAGWALMLIGFGLVGSSLRRRATTIGVPA